MSDPITNTPQTRCLIFDQNPCISPLLNFHGRFISLCSTELDSSGMFCDLITRIMTAIISPLAYLALGLLALLGVILTPCSRNTDTAPRPELQEEETPQEREILQEETPQEEEILQEETPDDNRNLFSRRIQCSTDQIINALENMNLVQNRQSNWQNIAATKLYIQSKVGESTLTTELLFQEDNHEGLNRSSIQENISEALHEAITRHTSSQEFTEPLRFQVKWLAFLKYSNGDFQSCQGYRLVKEGRPTSEGEFRGFRIGADQFEEYAARCLPYLEIRPQALLDSDNHFI